MTSGWLSWVRANDVEIMTLLQNQASILVKASSVLAESISDFSTLKENNTTLKNLEQEGDELTHKLFTIIDKTFITPLDKEDISELTSAIDQVLIRHMVLLTNWFFLRFKSLLFIYRN